MFRLNRNLKVLFIINLAIALCYSSVYPLFPLFLNDLGASVVEISLVLFIGGVCSTAIMMPAGLLSDRYRRRNILILSSALLALAMLYLAMVSSWEQSIIGFLLYLCAFSLFLPARHTLIADNSEIRSMTTTYSFLNISWPVGSIIGPALGGFLADNYGWNYAFYVAASVSLVSIVPAFLFKRTYRGDKKRDREETGGTFFTKEVVILLVVFSLSQIFLTTAIGMMDPVVPLYLTQTFKVSKTAVGFFFSMGRGVATLATQIPSGLLADRYGRKRILSLSILPLAIIISLWPSIQNYVLLMLLYMFIIGFWSMTWPVTPAYLMNLTPTLERGRVISINQTAIRLGFTVGPLIGGYFWHAYSPTTPFYVSAVFFALSSLFVLLLRRS